jgi:hypothetical protein
MKPRIQDHSENSDAFSPETFSLLRPLRLLVWRVFDEDRAEAVPPLPHRDLTLAHLTAISERHRGTLEELWLDLTHTTLRSRDVWAFLATMIHVRRLTLWVPPQCFSLLTLLATLSDAGFLPSFEDFELGVTCSERSTRDREAIIPLPLSCFATKLQCLRLLFFIGDGVEHEAVEARLRGWLEETRVSDASVRGTEMPWWLTFEFTVESGDDDDQRQRGFGFDAGDGS